MYSDTVEVLFELNPINSLVGISVIAAVIWTGIELSLCSMVEQGLEGLWYLHEPLGGNALLAAIWVPALRQFTISPANLILG